MIASLSAHYLNADGVRRALTHSVALAISCLVSYWVVTQFLAHVYSLSVSDDLLGGMWAMVATLFVYRDSYERSVAAALSRMASTSVSFILCLVYLLIFPFSMWGLVALIGIGAFALTLIGRSGDIVTTGITTAVVMVVVALSPEVAWLQPILRVADTLVGVAVGVGAVWIGLRVTTSLAARTSPAMRELR